ncbi:MAG: hypothetical protein ACOZAN_01680 [Patescibacteria group bacterium]
MINAMGSAPSPQINNSGVRPPAITSNPNPVVTPVTPADSNNPPSFKKRSSKFSLKNVIAGVVLLVAIVGSVAAYVLSQQTQDVRNQAQMAYPCCTGSSPECQYMTNRTDCINPNDPFTCTWNTSACGAGPTNTPRPPTSTPQPSTAPVCCTGSSPECQYMTNRTDCINPNDPFTCTWNTNACGSGTTITPSPTPRCCYGNPSNGTICSDYNDSRNLCRATGCSWNAVLCGDNPTGSPANCQAGCYDPTPNDGYSECQTTMPHCPNGLNDDCECNQNGGTCEVDENGVPSLYACFYSCPYYYEEVPRSQWGGGCPPSTDSDITWTGYCEWYHDGNGKTAEQNMEAAKVAWMNQSYCGVRQWDSCLDSSWSEYGPPCEGQVTPPPAGPQCNNIQLLDSNNQVLTGDADRNLSRGSLVHFQCAATGAVHHYEFRVMQPNGTITKLAATGAMSSNYTLPETGRYAAQCRVCTSETTCHPYEDWPFAPQPTYSITGVVTPRVTTVPPTPTPTPFQMERRVIDWGTGDWQGPFSLRGLPGSGEIQATTLYALPNGQYQQIFWRGNTGYRRNVPVSGNIILWTSATQWESDTSGITGPNTGSGNVQALTTYRLPNGQYQQGLWRGNQGYSRTAPPTTDGSDINWSAPGASWSGPVAISSLPGSGDIQMFETYPLPNNTHYEQMIARSNIIYTRVVPVANGVLNFSAAQPWKTWDNSMTNQWLNPGRSSGNMQLLSIYQMPNTTTIYGISIWRGDTGYMKENMETIVRPTTW